MEGNLSLFLYQRVITFLRYSPYFLKISLEGLIPNIVVDCSKEATTFIFVGDVLNREENTSPSMT
jgi:hypothetical protein